MKWKIEVSSIVVFNMYLRIFFHATSQIGKSLPKKGTNHTGPKREQITQAQKGNKSHWPKKGTNHAGPKWECLTQAHKGNKSHRPKKRMSHTGPKREQITLAQKRNKSHKPKKGTNLAYLEREQITTRVTHWATPAIRTNEALSLFQGLNHTGPKS